MQLIYEPYYATYFSENESTIGKEDRKRKARTKRRKTIDKAPCLTILSYDKENEELECLLEFSNRNSVTFKFDTEGDKPDEIAESLVCMIKKAPCLTILSYDKENEELECLLEFSNRNSVTFKFDTEGDKPDEIAESLVCMI